MSLSTELTAHSTAELLRMYRRKETTPAAVLEACIARIEQLNPLVNAVTATCFERAREEATASTKRYAEGAPNGALDGLPLGVKDLLDTKDLLSTYGAKHLRNNVPDQDSPWVAQLRQAGAIIVGKTNVPEMGAGGNTRNPVWGATGNPFDPALNAGGSSGGSAAALALDLLPLCTGSDTGGSLRLPAALCGVIGFRPTANLVPNGARTLGWSNLSVMGPMARNMEDLLLFLHNSLGQEPTDPLSFRAVSEEFSLATADLLKGLRIGYSEDFGDLPVEPEVRETFRDRVASLAEVAQSCEPVDLQLGEMDRCFDITRAEAFVAVFEGEMGVDEAGLAPTVAANLELARNMTLRDKAWAHLEQTRLLRRYVSLMQDYDVILTPTTPVRPFSWQIGAAMEVEGQKQDTYYRWLALTYRATLFNCPALTLPSGRTPAMPNEMSMPFGLQILGRPAADAVLLRVASAIEDFWKNDPLRCRPVPDAAGLTPSEPSLTSIVTHPPTADSAKSTRAVLNVV